MPRRLSWDAGTRMQHARRGQDFISNWGPLTEFLQLFPIIAPLSTAQSRAMARHGTRRVESSSMNLRLVRCTYKTVKRRPCNELVDEERSERWVRRTREVYPNAPFIRRSNSYLRTTRNTDHTASAIHSKSGISLSGKTPHHGDTACAA
jgi:hypothetical protein